MEELKTEDLVLVLTNAEYIWLVNADYIASDRAEYYAGLEYEKGLNQIDLDGDPYDITYNIEYHNSINDPFILKDWLLNNMNWDEIPDEQKSVQIIKNEELPAPHNATYVISSIESIKGGV